MTVVVLVSVLAVAPVHSGVLRLRVQLSSVPLCPHRQSLTVTYIEGQVAELGNTWSFNYVIICLW